MGQLQAEAMFEAISAGLDRRASDVVRSQLEVGSLASTWMMTIGNLPSDKHHVLVAVTGNEVQGFAAVAPSAPAILDGDDEDGLDAETGEPRIAYEITNFHVPMKNAGQGHEARLLAAITDILVDATEIHMWVIAGYDQQTHFLNGSGFAPRPIRRVAEIDGGEVAEHLWWTTLTSDAQ